MQQDVTVRWLDGYLEVFSDLDEVRFSPGLLFLAKGTTNRHVPLVAVRWFSLAIESHEPPLDDHAVR